MNFNLLNIFQVNDYFEIDEILWFIVIALLFLNFVLFSVKAIKIEEKSQKRVYLGYGLFSLLFGFTRLFFVFAGICGNAFEGCDNFYLIFGYLVGTFGLIIIIFNLETYLLKTRKILTSITIILFCIIVVILFVFPPNEGRGVALTLIYIFNPAVVIAILVSFIYLIEKSTGLSRKKAIGVLIAICLIFLGHTINTTVFYLLFPDTPSLIAPIVMISGLILFTISQLLIK